MGKSIPSSFARRREEYLYVKTHSPIACPLVVAPKATAPFIRLCGDYRPIVALYLIRHVPYIRTVQSFAFSGIKLKEHSDNNLNN